MKAFHRSFRFRLWLYFVIFTALIFTVLWLLQTVFLQNFYDAMLISNTKDAAQSIIQNGTDDDINDLIDELTRSNSILVYITDTEGNIYYSSDEFRLQRGNDRIGKKKQMGRNGWTNESSDELPSSAGGNGIGKSESDQGKANVFPDEEYRRLPEMYSDFLTQLGSSENEAVELREDGMYVYGAYFEYLGHEGEKTVLYISTTIETVGPSVSIIRMQLIWVTVLSLLTGFVLSWFIAKKFSKPVDRLSAKARRLGEKDYSQDFRKGFCSELDELSDTLDSTNDKLNRSREFQMELLANVSHDLRTPLTMIKGYAEMVRDISWSDEEQCASDLAVIVKETDRLTALVNEILVYSELQTEDDPGDVEPVDLSALLERVADSFETLYKPEGIVVERDIQKGVIVNGNVGRLERAFYNLADNAFRHTGTDKTIKLSLTIKNGRASASVSDHGQGIDPKELPHIWDRYYTSRQRGGKGVSGLGLAIVRQIVTLHKGTCRAESEPGNGSVFTVELPILC